MKELAVFGLGRLGRKLAETYSRLGGKVIVVDKSQEKIDDIADTVTLAVKADVIDEKVIKSIGVSNVDVVVVAMGENFEATIICITVCKKLGVPKIIAKAKNVVQGEILTKIGADEVIIPEDEIGERMANNIAHGDQFMDIAQISKRFSIVEAKVPTAWLGKSLMELNPRKKYGINVIAIKEDDRFQINIDSDKKFTEDMLLVVLGSPQDMTKIFRRKSGH